jgi:hypothetical protein
VPPGPGVSLVEWRPTPLLQHFDGVLASVPSGHAKRIQQLPLLKPADPGSLDLNSSAGSYRAWMRMSPAPSLPLSGGRPSVSFLDEGTIDPGCDSR